MKKIICIALIIISLPIFAITLVGCGKTKNISKFYNSYLSIAEKYKYLKVVEISDDYGLNISTSKVAIDYSSTPILENKVNNPDTKYYYLHSFYNQLLDDALSPLYFYGPKVSESKISKSKTKLLYNKLDELDEGFDDLTYYQGILASSLQTSNDNNVNYAHLNNLFKKYEELINDATSLSLSISDIYFNNVLDNGNPDYSNINPNNITDADITLISTNTRTRLYYYKALFTESYYHLYIRGNNIPEKIIESAIFTPENTYDPKNYLSNLNTSTSASIESLRNQKASIYNYAITLYHIQSQIGEKYENFKIAKDKVVYLQVNENSSIDDKNYAGIISQFTSGIVHDSFEVISQLCNIIYQNN